MHKMYGIIDYDNEKYIAKLTVEEFSDGKGDTLKRMYNLQDIKIEPVRHVSFTAEQSHLKVLKGSDISVSDLFRLVKSFEKIYYQKK